MNGIQEVRGSNPLSSTTCFHDLNLAVAYKECGYVGHFFLNKERCLFCREFYAWSLGEKHRSHPCSFIRNGSSVSHGTPISIPSYIKMNETFSALLPCLCLFSSEINGSEQSPLQLTSPSLALSLSCSGLWLQIGTDDGGLLLSSGFPSAQTHQFFRPGY